MLRSTCSSVGALSTSMKRTVPSTAGAACWCWCCWCCCCCCDFLEFTMKLGCFCCPREGKIILTEQNVPARYHNVELLPTRKAYLQKVFICRAIFRCCCPVRLHCCLYSREPNRSADDLWYFATLPGKIPRTLSGSLVTSTPTSLSDIFLIPL